MLTRCLAKRCMSDIRFIQGSAEAGRNPLELRLILLEGGNDSRFALARAVKNGGGRLPAFDPQLYKLRHAIERGINRLKCNAPSPPATKPLCMSPPSTSGSRTAYETRPSQVVAAGGL